MTTYEETAPELSDFVSESTAKAFAENLLSRPTITYRTLSDLTPTQRSSLFTWLKWFGQQRKPVDVEWVNWSPGKVASELRMSKTYVMSLIAERNAIITEVSTYGSVNAFVPHIAAVISNIESDGYTMDGYDTVLTGDLTITGTTMLSQSSNETVVTFIRGETTLNRTKTQIEADGGSVADTEIVIGDGTLPVNLRTGDIVKITANGFTSEGYII